MKTQIFATLSSLTLLTAAAAFAQSDPVMQVDIPFVFHIGARTLPAGQYELRHHVIGADVLLMRCHECKAGAVIFMDRAHVGKTPESATLAFNQYNNTYFLSRVRIPEYLQEKTLSKSKAELEFARDSSPVPHVEIALVRQ